MSAVLDRGTALSAEQKRALLKRKLTEAATATHPLSHGQQALWFLHQMAPYSAAYNIAFAVRVRSRVDLARLTRAFQVLTARHGSLRTTFPTLEGRPVQRVDAHRAFHLEQTDVGGWSAQEVHRRVVETYRRPFDLEAGPLLRAHLFTIADDDSVLLLSGHHIIGDGWSLWTLLEEWRTLYENADAGAAALAPLAFDYADHVRLQEQMLAGPRGESLRAYWHERLAGALPPLALPTDRPRPAIQRHRGASIPFAFSAGSTRALRALAKTEGVTLYTLLLAAYQVLLHRYCAQDSILVGSPMAGRTHQAYAGVVGYFVNPVVLRADLSGSPSFRDVLRQARDTVLGALAHQDYPFSLLVEQLRAGRDASRHPLFQVSFMLQKSQQSDEFIGLMASAQGTRRVEWKNLSLEPYELMQQEGQFDLTMEIVESSEALVGVLKYSTDLYERVTIERMAGHYARLLEAIVADPAAPIAGLELVPDAERALLAQWNRTEREYRHDASIHELIEEQVRRTPQATAICDEDDALTYAALDERADRLARRLVDLGVGRDVRVGICVERSLDMVVGLLAILKAGGAYLPLDPHYPAERIAFMLHDAGVGVVVTQEALLGLVGSAGARVVCLDSDRESIERTGDAGSAASQVSSEDLAYVIYTSGSTGKPKGVMVRHRNVVNFFTGMDDAIGAGEGAAGEQPVWLAVTSISFDISVLELFWTLARGYRVVINREQPGASATELLNRHRVTHLQCTPSFLRMLIDQDGAADALRGLSALLVGGEPLAPSLAQRVAGLTHAALFNMYGPTETTVWSTVKRVDGPVGHSVPIGRPIANTRVHLLDSTLQPVPVGVAGELYIGGAGVTRGYLHRSDLTEARFVADRFCDEPDARMYRTGDIARYSGDGELVFLGRADDQVKVRGHRIEIGEIEFALSRHPGVRNAAVAVRVDAGDARLVGYVAAADDASPSAGELRRFLAAQLPEYMIPAAFVFLDALPLTPNGKIDRRALPAADGAAVASAARYEVPATETERAIAAVWQALLGIESVGVHDNFFELGGHSLLATQMVSRLRSALAADVPLRAVFDTPTLRELAARVEALRGAGAGNDAEPILPVARTHDLPLSFAQQRLWFLGQLETGHAAVYNNSAALRLSGELDAGRVGRVLCEIVARHEALRTTFADREGTPIQVVHAALDWDVALDDLRGLAAAEREDSLQRLIAEEAGSVFDLTTGPLFRARLVRCADHDHVLIATTHHIVSDGWSMGVMTREFAVLYEAFGKGDTSPLPALTLHYADYAAWQRHRLQGAALDAQLQYWRAELANAPAVLELPTDRPRPAAQSFRGATLHFELPRELLGQLKALAQHAGATLFMTLLAAFATLLSRYSGQSEVVIGSPIANRTRTELE
ncbi:MAG: linear gramicidin synthase subunit, partial [Betaproteobacteria bacterium]|nr:linear gramicidin synthase subunit [Betaproteobacteria bacterium]